MCEHAAACLLMECRKVQRPIAERQEPEVEQQPSPSSGKWMLERFRKLTKVGRLSRKELPTQAMLALPAIPHTEVVVVGPSGTTPAVRAKPAVSAKRWIVDSRMAIERAIAPPALVQGRHEYLPPAHVLNDAPGKCAVEMLGGPEAQDKVIELIQTSESWEVIRLLGFTFDYGPLVAALCAAKSLSLILI